MIRTGRPLGKSVLEATCSLLGGEDADARHAAELASTGLSALASSAQRFKRDHEPPLVHRHAGTAAFRGLLGRMAAVSRGITWLLGDRRARPAAQVDFLGRRRLAGLRASWQARSGLDRLGDGLFAPEAESYFRRVGDELNASDAATRRLACIEMMVFLTGTSISGFSDIAIGDAPDTCAFVTADLSHFHCRADGLLKSARPPRGGPHFRTTHRLLGTPLPAEVRRALKKLQPLASEPRNLAELLHIDEATREAMTAYRRERSPSSRAVTETRVRSSYARLAIEHCGDEGTASILAAGDSTVSTESLLHYVLGKAPDLDWAASQVLRAIGLSGELAAASELDFSLNDTPSDATIAAFIKANVDRVLTAICPLPSNARPATLLARFNAAAPPLAALVRFLGALRPVRHIKLSMRGLSLEGRWAVVTADKATSEYLDRRLVALPEPLPSLLVLYFQRLSELADRIEPVHPRLAGAIRDRLASDSTLPVLFQFSGVQIVDIPKRSVDRCFRVRGVRLDENVGRRVVEHIVRAAGFGSIEAAAQSGHAGAGQEPFARGSGLRPDEFLGNLHSAWKSAMTTFGLDPLIARIPRTRWSPRPAAFRLRPAQPARASGLRGHEQCPFPPDMAHAYRVLLHVGSVLALPANPLARVAACLVILDGIGMLRELEALLVAIETDEVRLRREPFIALLDTKIPGLGLRRVQLSPVTVLAIRALPDERSDVHAALSDLGACVAKSLDAEIPPADALGQLLAGVRAAQTLHWPGLARSLAQMQYNCRTAHPDSLSYQSGEQCRSRIERVDLSSLAGEEPATSTAEELWIVQRLYLRKISEGTWAKLPASREQWELACGVPVSGMSELARVYFALLHELFRGEKRRRGRGKYSVRTLPPYISSFHSFLLCLADEETPLEQLDLQVKLAEWRSRCEASGKQLTGNFDAMANRMQEILGLPAFSHVRPCLADNYIHPVAIESVDKAVECLAAAKDVPVDIARLAGKYLVTLRALGCRPDEGLKVRWIDLHGGARPFANITRAAESANKSASGERLVEIEPAEYSGIFGPCLEEHAVDPESRVLGDADNPRSLATAKAAVMYARAALKYACGSLEVRLHDIRGAVITRRQTPRLLDPQSVGLHTSLQRRNVGALGAAENGHASPLGGPAMYFHEGDRVRRILWDRLVVALGLGVSKQFVGELCGRSVDAMRKWQERNGGSRTIVECYLLQQASVACDCRRIFALGSEYDRQARTDVAGERLALPATHGAKSAEVTTAVLRLLCGAQAWQAARGTKLTNRDVELIVDALQFWRPQLRRAGEGLHERLHDRADWRHLVVDCAAALALHPISDIEARVLAGTAGLVDEPWAVATMGDLQRCGAISRFAGRLAARLHVPARAYCAETIAGAKRVGIFDVVRSPATDTGLRVSFRVVAEPRARSKLREAPGSLIASAALLAALVHRYIQRNTP